MVNDMTEAYKLWEQSNENWLKQNEISLQTWQADLINIDRQIELLQQMRELTVQQMQLCQQMAVAQRKLIDEASKANDL